MHGDMVITFSARLVLVVLLIQVVCRPILRRVVEHWSHRLADRVSDQLDRAGLALEQTVREWLRATVPRRSEQRTYVPRLSGMCQRHLARRMVFTTRLEEMKGDPGCGAISVLRVFVTAIRAERKVLAALDPTYALVGALLPIALWGPVYSLMTWISGESSTNQAIAESVLKVGMLFVAVTLGDPYRVRDGRAVRMSLDVMIAGFGLSAVFSSYVDASWTAFVATIVYKVAMVCAVSATWAIRRQSINMKAARWAFLLAGSADLIALPSVTHDGLRTAMAINVVLIALAYRTARSDPEFYFRIGGDRPDHTLNT